MNKNLKNQKIVSINLYANTQKACGINIMKTKAGGLIKKYAIQRIVEDLLIISLLKIDWQTRWHLYHNQMKGILMIIFLWKTMQTINVCWG